MAQKRKFKIHANEVRKAAKKTKLEIVSGTTLDAEPAWDRDTYAELNYYEGDACPIAQLYVAKTKNYDADTQDLWNWAHKRFGKDYCNGFVEGFDDPSDLPSWRRGEETKEYMLGHENGRRLHKFLLNK